MPAKSQAQRAYLNAHFGHGWVKEHGFDNKGKLPAHVRKGKAVKEKMLGEVSERGGKADQEAGEGRRSESMARQGEVGGHLEKAMHHLSKAIKSHKASHKAHHRGGKGHKKRGHAKARGHSVPRGVGHY